MSFWNALIGYFNGSIYGSENCSFDSGSNTDDSCNINPANGLPMLGGCVGVDIEGNPFGTDLWHNNMGASNEMEMSDYTSCSDTTPQQDDWAGSTWE